MIGTIIGALGGIALLAIGIGAIVAPVFSSGQYGLPTTDRLALALIRSIGARDVVLGILIVVFLTGGNRDAAAVVLVVSIIAAIADAFAVRMGRDGAAASTYAVHVIGGVGLFVAWLLIRIGW